MISQQQQQISASTRYRYKAAGREKDLGSFLEFKKEYENSIDKEKIVQLKQVYQHAILGRNSVFQTVVLDRVGVLKMVQVNKIVDDEAFYAYMCQRMLHLSQKVLKEKEKVVWIIDLSGKIMQLASKRTYTLFDKLIPMLEKFFPDILAKLYFINTPMLFDTIWSKISDKVNPETADKIQFLTDELSQLYHDADVTILPECLGGDCENQKIFLSLENDRNQEMEFKQQEEDDQQIDMNSLKQALSGLQLGGKSHPSVANTPLNTEADDYKKKQ